jgi:hypothetical protein
VKYGLTMTVAAAVLAGTMALGCDSKAKQENADAAKPTHPAMGAPPTTQAGGTTPMTPDKKVDQAMQSMGDKATDMKGKASAAGDAMSAEAQKMKDKVSPTTAPAIPGLPPMK